jgi:hypothetical protein
VSRYASAQWRPIRDTSTAALRKGLLSLHTMVGGMRGTWSYFDRLDVQPYSHFLVGGPWGSDAGHGLDGVAWQIADTQYRAAANLDGNWRCISVETADNAERPIKPWTDAQCEAIIRIGAEAHQVDGIPLVLVPDSKQGRRGWCYHRQGCDPYRVAGGERWSKAYGKDCPTDPRIRQIPDLIIDARRLVAGQTPQEDDMPLNDDDKAWLRSLTGAGGGVTPVSVTQDVYNRLHAELVEVRAAQEQAERDLAALRTLVDTRLPAIEA